MRVARLSGQLLGCCYVIARVPRVVARFVWMVA